MHRSTPSLRRSSTANRIAPLIIALLLLALTATGCSMMSGGATDATNATRAADATDAVMASKATAEEAVQEAAAKISFANGEANWIITEGLSRNGRDITFKEVQINGNGWLVLHPFRDGRPNGDIHVGASYLRNGSNQDVTVTITQETEPQPGEMLLVMLHSDVDEDQVFDFVFVDERNVLDKAVFEGMTMIAHIFPVP